MNFIFFILILINTFCLVKLDCKCNNGGHWSKSGKCVMGNNENCNKRPCDDTLGLFCDGSKCSCSQNSYWSNVASKCVVGRGSSCSSFDCDPAITGLSCNSARICQCSIDRYWNAATQQCVNCGSNSLILANKYVLYRDQRNWNDAKALCACSNISLMVANDQNEYNIAETALKSNSITYAWIGLKYDSVSSLWLAVDGTSVEDSNSFWYINNYFINKNYYACVTFTNRDTGGYYNDDCSSLYSVLCENQG